MITNFSRCCRRFRLDVLSLLALGTTVIHADSIPAAVSGELEAGFTNPPARAKPHTWWHWMNGNISKEAITADLESMARVGIGGTQIFNVAGSHGCEIPPGPVDYLSPEWLDLMKHAATEAKRLGMEICFQNCAGWATTGGPWITPEIAMQALVNTETKVVGGKRIVLKLALPAIKENYYRDIAICAFPTPENDRFRVHKWHPKAAQAGNQPNRKPDLKPVDFKHAIPLESIVDVTKNLRKDGTLVWDAPAGNWTILRLGHTPTGALNHPAPESGRGLEIDKFRNVGIDVHWRKGIQPLLDHLGPLAGKDKVFNNILIDSYESGHNQWSPCLPEEFKNRRGYDPKPYFLALTGRLVEDVATTERFLWDHRRTVADLYADNYYSYFADLIHKNDLLCSIEPYRVALDSPVVATKADIPMGEFWSGGGFEWSLKVVSSAAHTNGTTLAGAESFTAAPKHARWTKHPGVFRCGGDLAWAEGVNRLILATFTHQPWADKPPGLTLGKYGPHFERTNTWWEPGRAWMHYIARSQFLLQSGEPVTDVLCFSGEFPPVLGLKRADIKSAGYDYDLCGTEVMETLKVTDGKIVLPSGKEYRLLVLPNAKFQTPGLARKIRDLVRDGATVVGNKPSHSPSLSGFPATEQEMLSIAGDVWGKCDGKTVKSNRYGKGRVFNGVAPAEVLAELNVAPAALLPTGLVWIHRSTADADIFFVSNQTNNHVTTAAGFHAVGKSPELWDAEMATMQPAAGWKVEGSHVRMPLELAPEKSVFVVFRKSAKPASQAMVRQWGEKTLPLTGPWNLSFQPKRGAPATAKFDELIPWNEHADPGIKYFSGTATNSTRFDLPKGFLKNNPEVWLDLGQVEVIAEVRINGKNLGVLWHKPFKLEVGKYLKPGANTLEIDVTNLWANRLIGDEQYPTDVEWTEDYLTKWPDWLISGTPRPSKQRITFSTRNHWQGNEPLLPSGLIGPVTLRGAHLAPAP